MKHFCYFSCHQQRGRAVQGEEVFLSLLLSDGAYSALAVVLKIVFKLYLIKVRRQQLHLSLLFDIV